MNKWQGIGRLTKDPELRYGQSGVAVTSFTIAVDRRFKNAQGEKETDFIQIKTFKQLAELCSNYLAKGKLAGVTGELHINSYTDRDGNKKWITEINADEVDFLSPKDSDTGAPAQNPQTQRQQAPMKQQPPYPTPGPYGQPSMPPYPGQYGQQQQGYMQPPPGIPPMSPQPPQQPQQQGYWLGGNPPGSPQYGQPAPQQAPPGAAPFNANQLGIQIPIDDDIPF